MIFYKFTHNDMSNFTSFLSSAMGYLITSLSLYLAMLLLFFFFNRKKDNTIISKIKIKKVLFYISIAIISFLTLYPVVTCFDTLLVKLGAKINNLTYTLSTKNYFISLLSLVLAPAVCEELLFRGIILSGLKKHGKTFSITITALMFCIFHMAISQTIYPLLMGLLLCVIMHYEENIYYTIIVHLTNNFLSLTLSYFKISLIFQHWTYILLAILLFLAFTSIVLYFTIKNNKNQEKQPLSKMDKIFLYSSVGVMLLFWIMVNFI